MTFGVLDFIHADGVDLAQFAVCQSPMDDVFDSIENLIPGSAKSRGRFLPGKPTCPLSQKQHISFSQSTFAVAPGNFLHDHGAAATAIHAAHCVEEEDQKSPQGDELETAFGELVVTRCRQMTARADGRRTTAGTHGDFDALLVGTEAGMLVDKAPEMMAAV